MPTNQRSPLVLPRSPEGVPPVVVQVEGKGALFSRPELKVERVTYPVMTPTAARGMLEAIFWKPPDALPGGGDEVLKPIRQFTVRRNETHQVVSLSAAVRGDRVDTAAHRDQRNAVCLREVAYRIHAHIESAENAGKNAAAYRDQFRRRVSPGGHVSISLSSAPAGSAQTSVTPTSERIRHTEDLGVMLHTIHFGPPMRMEWFTAPLATASCISPPRASKCPPAPLGSADAAHPASGIRRQHGRRQRRAAAHVFPGGRGFSGCWNSTQTDPSHRQS